MRLALADSGDSIDVANFDQVVADNIILRLFTINEQLPQTLAMVDEPVSAGALAPFDERVFVEWTRQCALDCHKYYSGAANERKWLAPCWLTVASFHSTKQR